MRWLGCVEFPAREPWDAGKDGLSEGVVRNLEDRRGPAAASGDVRAYAFSGHETFPFRYAWLHKGVRYLDGREDLFVSDDALVVLGVGKNMVRSIRHWCEAVEIIERSDRRGRAEVTPFGHALFAAEGWDPFLEDPGTLWILHWRLAHSRRPASTWHLAFTVWNEPTFTRDGLVTWLLDLAKTEGRTQATQNSMRRDVEVFVRTYVPSGTKRDLALEDTFDCPLVDLGLISEQGKGLYQFERGPKPTLPDEIFAYALLDFWCRSAPEQETLSFERVLYAPGSPGAAFKLSENALAERLERVHELTSLSYDDTAGMRLVLRPRSGREMDLTAEAFSVLCGYYEDAGGAW